MTSERRFGHPSRWALGLLALIGVGAALLLRTPPSPGRHSAPPGTELITRGAYLARVGNCAGCHTAPGGAELAGGPALPTPFGKVYAGNLTPEPETGLGRWSADDFWRALHEGRSRDGRRLLPAFPYTSFTQVTRADSDALFAYLRSRAAVKQANPAHQLRFPYNTHAAMVLWQWLFFTPGTAGGTAPAADPVLDRGAYLVNGLGHCAACHAPRNALGAPGSGMTGGDMPAHDWFAPSLHPVPGQGITEQDLVDLLRVGRHRLGSASGPMASVVFRSTQHWTDEDLHAASRYLLSLRPEDAPSPMAAAAAQASPSVGRQLYDDRCADCHGAQGQGQPGVYPPLAGNPTVLQPSVRNLVQVLKHGSFAPATAGNPRPYGMPPQELSVAETTALINHLRQTFAERAPPVTEVEVLRFR